MERFYKFSLGQFQTQFPSASVILDQIDKSQFLIPWAVNEMASFIRMNGQKEIGEVEPEYILTETQLLLAKDAYKTKSQDAMDTGSVAHDIVNLIMSDKPYSIPADREVTNAIYAFYKFMKDYKVKKIEAEKPVCHYDVLKALNTPFSLNAGVDKALLRPLAFSGTPDLIAEIDGVVTLLDWKTSKNLYPTYDLQVAGYMKLRNSLRDVTLIVSSDRNGEPFTEEFYYPAVNIEQCMLVQLNKETGEYTKKIVKDIERKFEAICALSNFWWLFKNRKIDSILK